MPNAWVRAFNHMVVAPILTVGSGHPVNVTTGGDDNRTGAFPFASRPLNVGRNSWRLPASATLDLRILKYFTIKPHGKLDLVIEAFNVLNLYERHPGECRLRAVSGITPIVRSSD